MHIHDDFLVVAGQPDLLAANRVQTPLHTRDIRKILARNQQKLFRVTGVGHLLDFGPGHSFRGPISPGGINLENTTVGIEAVRPDPVHHHVTEIGQDKQIGKHVDQAAPDRRGFRTGHRHGP